MSELKQKERIAPGIWIDTDGHTHISIPDILDHFGWPHDEEHKRGVEQVVHKMLQGKRTDIRLVERCPNCGAKGKDVHSAICALR
jgi:hypothetical protein